MMIVFHDRYIILDKNIFYHCGTSLNNARTKTFSINQLTDDKIKEVLIKAVEKKMNE